MTGRQDRRKAETRRRIVAAADTLFSERGYAATSIEDIAAEADVAVRTIYLHFGSKASIMLTYVDEWLDAFAAAVCERPPTEPVAATARAAVAAMTEAGWVDRVEVDDARPHPLVEHVGSGPSDIAGHVMHRWMEAMARITAAATEAGADPLDAQARAVALFAFWTGALFSAREKQDGRPLPASAGDSPGQAILARMTSGTL